MDLLEINQYNRPKACIKCGGVMVFKGVGEYQCEDCGAVDFDDYGKVRRYIETHRGANAGEIEEATGVTQRSIRMMLKESRIEVAKDSKLFLHCELCGKDIRYGTLCTSCESSYHRRIEEQQRSNTKKNISGYSMAETSSGAKRFTREK